MNEKSIYIINTGKLFHALNQKRTDKELDEIDNSLMASRLGILFALKTNVYVNFKGEFVELNDSQLIALREILDQHFNAEMTTELRQLVQTKEIPNEPSMTDFSSLSLLSSAPPPKKGIFNKFKSLFKGKSKVQESHA